ncbi:MAG TPA: hypothetical protein VHW64_09550 [Nocardioides sp.]|uniref:hypothetical protein n=1 Tax=Nocardioides sp. TaxID=35761 RepID=UPI002E30DA52|nr:hypothetical protein [Nocardioides sp.]HEX3930938.1 hypothetical protein [Nocardioides sp.]
MRTTVTLDDDTEQIVRARMKARHVSFKKALNDAIREAAGSPRPERFQTLVFDMGVPRVDLTKALQLSAELEDEELLRKMRRGT